MASSANSSRFLLPLLLPLMSLLQCSMAALVESRPVALAYHKGQLLTGPISINLIWYGNFTPSQRAVVTDFVTSLSSSHSQARPQHPSVSSWWRIVEKYHLRANSPLPILTVGTQTLDDSYSLGKTSLTSASIASLAARGGKRRSVNVVLTAEDVAVDGFCVRRCGAHGASPRSKSGRYAYIWVGNSATQCPGQCAWPFHQPMYGPQAPPVVAPNGDVGVDGMVVNLAGLLASTVTNPFGNGYFQGDRAKPLEAASACPGVYGKGAYPGYPGELLVDETNGGSYNAVGDNGRKFLLPALVDPATSSCSTLV